MNFIQFLAETLHSFDVTDSAPAYFSVSPVLGVYGGGDGLQGGLGVGDEEAAEAEQRHRDEALGGEHQQARAEGPAGAAHRAQTPESEQENVNILEDLWPVAVAQSLVSFMLIMISCSSSQVFNLICRLSHNWNWKSRTQGKRTAICLAEWEDGIR